MVLYLTDVAIENQCLLSCTFDLDKNKYAWYNSWWWMDKNLNYGICLPCFLFNRYELWSQLSDVRNSEMGIIEWGETILVWMR